MSVSLVRRALSVAVVLALCATSPASAHPPQGGGGGAVIAPSNGHELGEWLKTITELPGPVNPLLGWGSDPCVSFGPQDRYLVAVSFEDVTCTAKLGTVVYTGGGHFCGSMEDPEGPFYAVSRNEQRECARRVSRETAMRLRVDDGDWVELFQPQYTSYSPQTTVQLPVDNAWGVPPQEGTVTGYGWRANLRNLSVGRHTWTVQEEVDGKTHDFRHELFIVPR